MSKAFRIFRKVAVVAISLPIFVLGIILIPLPGPGLLISLLALVILSLEFEKARFYRDKIFAQLKKIWQQAKERSDAIKDQSSTKE